MIKLYDMNTRTFIDKFPNEFELIKAIEPTINDNKRYMIISRKDNTPYIYGIRSIKDFEVYKANYNRKMILDKSCVELKRDILDISESKQKKR